MEEAPRAGGGQTDTAALCRSLRRLAFILCGDRDLAEDLVQETFVRCMGRIDSLHDPGQYLRAALVNRWRSHERRRLVAARWLSAQRPTDPMIPAELVEWRKVLLALPSRQRGAIALRYLCELDDLAIAQALGVRPATVRSLVHRGLKTLKETCRADDL